MKGVPQVLYTSLVAIILFLLLFGCQLHNKRNDTIQLLAQHNRSLQEKNSQLNAKIQAQNAAAANLKLQLLEKNAEIKRLTAIQQELSRKIIRNQTRMTFPRSKAEAVMVVAEIEMEVNAAKKNSMKKLPQHSFDTPDKLMAKSKIELHQGNYTKACIVAAQALEQVKSLQLKAEIGTKRDTGTAKHLIFPLVMRVAKTCNIRRQPTMNSQVVRVLDKDTKVTATEYQGHWIKISIGQQPIGWIYFSLLAEL